MSTWFDPPPAPAGRPLLLTFPFAGGTAGFYRPWKRELEQICDVSAVQLPGRETRIREAPRSTLDPLVTELVDALPPLDRPFVLAGHSLGATLSLAVALELRRRRRRPPARLILSGSPAPHLRDLSDPAHLLADEALATRLGTYGGTPPEVLQSRELLDFFLPIIRADFAVVETWAVPAVAPLDIPFTVLAGREDASVTPSMIEGWRAWTTLGCDVHWLPGGHFFFASARPAVLEIVRDTFGCLRVETALRA